MSLRHALRHRLRKIYISNNYASIGKTSKDLLDIGLANCLLCLRLFRRQVYWVCWFRCHLSDSTVPYIVV